MRVKAFIAISRFLNRVPLPSADEANISYLQQLCLSLLVVFSFLHEDYAHE